MLAGAKPLALFSDEIGSARYFPETEFAPHVQNQRIFRREETYQQGNHTIKAVFYALPSETWRMEQAHQLLIDLVHQRVKDYREYDRKMGKLLGYTDQDIEVFIAHNYT